MKKEYWENPASAFSPHLIPYISGFLFVLFILGFVFAFLDIYQP